LPLSGEYYIMMKKLAQPGEGGGARGGARHPLSLYPTHHHIQSCGVSSSWEGRYTHPISTLPLYVLCASTIQSVNKSHMAFQKSQKSNLI
jgi:hypothetical protein